MLVVALSLCASCPLVWCSVVLPPLSIWPWLCAVCCWTAGLLVARGRLHVQIQHTARGTTEGWSQSTLRVDEISSKLFLWKTVCGKGQMRKKVIAFLYLVLKCPNEWCYYSAPLFYQVSGNLLVWIPAGLMQCPWDTARIRKNLSALPFVSPHKEQSWVSAVASLQDPMSTLALYSLSCSLREVNEKRWVQLFLCVNSSTLVVFLGNVPQQVFQ